jgi:hypothetical protein
MKHAFLFAIWLALPASGWDASQDLLDSARRGDLAQVKAALENQASLEAKTRYGQTPLYLAAMNGHTEVVRFLLEKGAQTDVTDTFYKSSAIGFAASRKHMETVKLLLPHSTEFDRNLDTATSLRNPELVAAVLAAGKPSQTALNRNFELAASHAEIAELLRKAGAQPPAPGVEVDAKILESYAGTYKADGFPLDIKVSTREGRLYAQGTGQPEFSLKARSATVFEFAPARIEMEFSGADGFTLRQGGQVTNFKKATP